MALTVPTNLLSEAADRNALILAVNVDSWDMAHAVVRAAEEARTGVILQVTAETLDLWGWGNFSRALLDLIAKAGVEAGLLLDHETRMENIQRAITLGFTGVMYDGSALPFDLNVQSTQRVVELARGHGVSVEGEIGHVARDGEPPEWEHITTVAEAQEFYRETGVDALAVAIGTRHGHQRQASDLRLDRLAEIHRSVAVPLVLHGGSGLATAVLGQLGQLGVSKVNLGTGLRKIWWQTLLAAQDMKPRQALFAASEAIRSYLRDKMHGIEHHAKNTLGL